MSGYSKNHFQMGILGPDGHCVVHSRSTKLVPANHWNGYGLAIDRYIDTAGYIKGNFRHYRSCFQVPSVLTSLSCLLSVVTQTTVVAHSKASEPISPKFSRLQNQNAPLFNSWWQWALNKLRCRPRRKKRRCFSLVSEKVDLSKKKKAQKNLTTNKPWSISTFVSYVGVSISAVKRWRANDLDLMLVNTNVKFYRKVKRMKGGQLLELEATLAVYLRTRMSLMNVSSLFRAYLIRSVIAEIVEQLADQFEAQIEKNHQDTSPKFKKHLQQKILQHTQFKCSQSWRYNFIRPQWFHSVKKGDEEGFLDQNRLVTEQLQLKKGLCKFDISCISNTDEVGNLYLTLPRNAVRDSDKTAS